MANPNAISLIDTLIQRFEIQQKNKTIMKITQQTIKPFNLSPLGRSALFMAAGRAVESNKPHTERAFSDPYAHLFADTMGKKYLKKMSKYAVSYIKFRTLYIDNHIENIINMNSNKKSEIIFLGIGCDTRSYRMDIINQNSNINVYELDLKDVIDYRYNILTQQNNAKSECKIIPIAVDFRDNEWINKLLNKGYNKNNCNLWIAEGLFPFLKKQEINNLLETIHKCCYSQSDNEKHTHWMIGNFLNKNTMLQSKLNKLNKQNGDTTCKTGYKRPHVLLENYGYSQWEIQPVGSLNKNIKTYQQYLDCIAKQERNSTTHIKADHFAKSFMFCASK